MFYKGADSNEIITVALEYYLVIVRTIDTFFFLFCRNNNRFTKRVMEEVRCEISSLFKRLIMLLRDPPTVQMYLTNVFS